MPLPAQSAAPVDERSSLSWPLVARAAVVALVALVVAVRVAHFV